MKIKGERKTKSPLCKREKRQEEQKKKEVWSAEEVGMVGRGALFEKRMSKNSTDNRERVCVSARMSVCKCGCVCGRPQSGH